MIKNKKETLIVLTIFAGAFVLRYLFMAFLRNNYFFYDYPGSDVLFYRDWAHEIARGNWLGNTVFYGMPLYPYFLAIIERITLGHLAAVRIAHLALGSFNCVLLYFVGKKIFSQKVAVLAAVLAATNFVLIYHDWLMMPVTLIITLTLVIILVLASLDAASPKRQWFFLGTLIGLAALGDGKLLIFFALLLPYLMARYRTTPLATLRRIVIPLVIGLTLIVGVVTVRNRTVGKDWVAISAHGGINFYIGNNPQATGIFRNPDFLRPYHGGHIDDPRIIAEATLKKRLRPSEVSRFWFARGMSFIRSSPKAYYALLRNKLTSFFLDAQAADDVDLILLKKWKERGDVNTLRLMWPLALIGMVCAFRNRRATASLNFIIASQLIVTLLFFLITRHRATIIPLLLLYESYAILWFFDAVRARRTLPGAVAVVFLIVAIAVGKPQKLEQNIVTFLRATKSAPILAERKQYQKAQEQYKIALQLQPFDTNTLYNLANAYLAQGDHEQALRYYRKVMTINPRDVDALYNMAYALENTGELQQALQAYEQVVALDPASYDAHLRRAIILAANGQCAQALVHLQFIAAHAPQYQEQVAPLIKSCHE